jgi:hypothetical protein
MISVEMKLSTREDEGVAMTILTKKKLEGEGTTKSTIRTEAIIAVHRTITRHGNVYTSLPLIELS